VDGVVTGIRFYKGSANTGTHVGRLWSASGSLLASATFVNETATGWQQVTFATPVAVVANTVYTASYAVPNGGYAVDRNTFTTAVTRGPLTAPATTDGGNGVFVPTPGQFPTQSYEASNYFVDVVFATNVGPDTTAPTVTSRTPAPGATGVAVGTSVLATFSEPMAAGTVTGTTVDLRGPSGTAVAATVSYDGATRTVTLDPTAALATNTVYTARVRGGSGGVTDTAGNPLAGDVTWTFTTAAVADPYGCPCTLWPASATPSTASWSDSAAYELGVRFRAAVDGVIVGIRFYKGPANTGTHVGRLWSAGGSQLASATFVNETATGWQEVRFATPVPVVANTVYTASYSVPNGGYAVDRNAFASAVTRGPLTAAADADGNNGVFAVGPGQFPTQSYQATNYWVDVIFQPQP